MRMRSYLISSAYPFFPPKNWWGRFGMALKVFLLSFLVVAFAASCNGDCYSFEFECDSGQCVDDDDQCDGTEDCYDGSDEDGCSAAAGLAIGLSIFFFILFCVVIPIVICVLIYCCVAGPLQNSLGGQSFVRTTVHAPPVTATPTAAVVTTTATDMKTDYPSGYAQPMQQYPPPGGYPPQGAYPPQAAYPPEGGYPAQPPPPYPMQ